MKPTVGRIVHYYDLKSRGPFAAIVTGTYEDDDVVDIDVHHRPTSAKHKASVYSHRAIKFREEGERWCWPPRVEQNTVNAIREVGMREASGESARTDIGTFEERKKGFGRE